MHILFSKTLRNFVIKNVFGEILNQSPVLQGKQRKKNSKKLRVFYNLFNTIRRLRFCYNVY